MAIKSDPQTTSCGRGSSVPNLTAAAAGPSSFDVLVIGGGVAGTTAAACLRNLRPRLSIAIVEPETVHHYRPGWTLVATGQAAAAAMQRPREQCIPSGVAWIRAGADRIDTGARCLSLADGRVLRYRKLLVATGLVSRWEQVDGLEATLGRNGVTSIYRADLAEVTRTLVADFTGGRALFVRPQLPIQCAGSAQSILYAAADLFRRRGLAAALSFHVDGPTLHGVGHYDRTLAEVARQYGIDLQRGSRLLAVDGERRTARFQRVDGTVVEQPFDLLHVAPPQGPTPLIAASGLGDADGWLPVDRSTLHHLRHPDVFGIGDCCSASGSKTVAAIRAQAPVVARNLLAAIDELALPARYDGYSACPILTSRERVLLAEFGHNGQLLPSFGGDPRLPRRRHALLKRHVLPRLYWRMLDGHLGIDWHAPLRNRRLPTPVITP